MEDRSLRHYSKKIKSEATMWLFVIDLIDGKVTDQEKKEMREMLLKITKGKERIKDEKRDNDDN